MAPMATCNAQPRTTHEVSEVRTPGPWERPAARLSCVAHGPTCGPFRTARRAAPAGWTMCRGGQFYHNSARQSAQASRPPCPEPQSATRRETGVALGQERGRCKAPSFPRTGRGPDRTSSAEQGYAVVCTDRQPAAAARPAAAWALGCRPQLAALFCPAGGMCVKEPAGEFCAPGKTQPPPWRTRRGRRGCA